MLKEGVPDRAKLYLFLSYFCEKNWLAMAAKAITTLKEGELSTPVHSFFCIIYSACWKKGFGREIG